MTRQELDQALARLGLDVPEKERDEITAATHLLEDMQARLRPPGVRSSMLLAASSQTAAKSRSSCFMDRSSAVSASCRYLAAWSRR